MTNQSKWRLKWGCLDKGSLARKITSRMVDHLGSCPLESAKISSLVKLACTQSVEVACTEGYHTVLNHFGYYSESQEDDMVMTTKTEKEEGFLSFLEMDTHEAFAMEVYRKCLSMIPIFKKVYSPNMHALFVQLAMRYSKNMLSRPWVEKQMKLAGSGQKSPEEACEEGYSRILDESVPYPYG